MLTLAIRRILEPHRRRCIVATRSVHTKHQPIGVPYAPSSSAKRADRHVVTGGIFSALSGRGVNSRVPDPPSPPGSNASVERLRDRRSGTAGRGASGTAQTTTLILFDADIRLAGSLSLAVPLPTMLAGFELRGAQDPRALRDGGDGADRGRNAQPQALHHLFSMAISLKSSLRRRKGGRAGAPWNRGLARGVTSSTHPQGADGIDVPRAHNSRMTLGDQVCQEAQALTPEAAHMASLMLPQGGGRWRPLGRLRWSAHWQRPRRGTSLWARGRSPTCSMRR